MLSTREGLRHGDSDDEDSRAPHGVAQAPANDDEKAKLFAELQKILDKEGGDDLEGEGCARLWQDQRYAEQKLRQHKREMRAKRRRRRREQRERGEQASDDTADGDDDDDDDDDDQDASPGGAKEQQQQQQQGGGEAPQQWACSRCTFLNAVADSDCGMCGQPRPIFSQQGAAAPAAVPAPGTSVVVRGLTGQQRSLNGKTGRVVGPYGDDRAVVDFGAPLKKKALRAVNLCAVPG
eukprot:TRINITY_DN5622_c0_g1_i1.p1 TRINITY_DN5622_c0_g1~~TRINITY_DN5622_c0_g1_i1.p1  ORF type:complete len:236 (+),score=79.21 TRINITY_DN5622_c0_g1_i1:72-779(+)